MRDSTTCLWLMGKESILTQKALFIKASGILTSNMEKAKRSGLMPLSMKASISKG